jgi:hypothetical protein
MLLARLGAKSAEIRMGEYPPDGPEDSRWVTYDQLAEARETSRASAIRQARRKKWRRQRDNRGNVTVLVPADELQPSPDGPPDGPADMSRIISVLESAVASLTARAEFAEKRVEQAGIEAKEAQARAIRAESDLAAEQKRAEQAEKTAEAAQIGRAEALQALEELREARARRAGQGRWARLRLAWRG